MFSIRRRRQWNGWNFIARRIRAVRRPGAGRGCSFAVVFGSRSWVRASKKELSGSAQRSKRRSALLMTNILLVCVHHLMRFVADFITQS